MEGMFEEHVTKVATHGHAKFGTEVGQVLGVMQF